MNCQKCIFKDLFNANVSLKPVDGGQGKKEKD